MSTSHVTTRYRTRYPRFGRVAFLCEGDVAGFEVDLIERWTSGVGYVDVWPCGTKTAMIGVCDSIGRAIPILAIEDRDARTIEEARKQCATKANDRTDRGVRIVDWRAWNRHEIENYLIEPGVLFPVLSDVFSLDDKAVLERVAQVIEAQRTDQAAQAAIAHFVSCLPEAGRLVPGLPRKTARPAWDGQRGCLLAVERALVREALEKEVDKQLQVLSRKSGSVTPNSALDVFDRRCAEWGAVTVDQGIWRTDWAGKEILSMVICRFTGEYGWGAHADEARCPLDWGRLNRADSGRREREVLEYLQPKLVASFLGFLDNQKDSDTLRMEWDSLRSLVTSAVESSDAS